MPNHPSSPHSTTTNTHTPHTPTTIPINIWHPTIDKTPITSTPQLLKIIDQEYPGLKHHPHYEKLLTDAQRHLNLLTALHNKPHLTHGDIATLARHQGVTRTVIYYHIRHAQRPRLYWLIDHAISTTQAHHQLTHIHQTNNRIHSLNDIKHRLHTYYPTQYLEHAPTHPNRLTQCRKYFTALTLLAQGGHSYTDIAKTIKKTVTNTLEWCTNHRRPGLLNLARRIPPTPPPPSHQWLPLTMHGRFHPTNFIHVPTTITTWAHIPPVLQQLTPLDNLAMTQWHHQFSPITQEEAFAYLLGNLVSDAGKITPTYTSTRIELNLSQNYNWSQTLGNAICYYLGLLGIHAQYKTSPNYHRWRSQNSPLLTWIKHTCLGVHPKDTTTYTPIKATWLLTAPKHIRVKFLQGLNDGDGYANTQYQKLGNASGVNSLFVQELFETFNIHGIINGPKVVIMEYDSVLRAVNLPFFLHAQGRQHNADKLARMIKCRFAHTKEQIPSKIISYINVLGKQGKKAGEIVELIFDKYEHCYYPKRIRKILKEQ